MATKIKAESAPIRDYLAALQRYADHEATREGATETAFSNLLAATAKPHGWMLIPKKPKTVAKKVRIVPDGTMLDVFRLARGYWEAKDTDDDLDAGIQISLPTQIEKLRGLDDQMGIRKLLVSRVINVSVDCVIRRVLS